MPNQHLQTQIFKNKIKEKLEVWLVKWEREGGGKLQRNVIRGNMKGEK